MEAERRSEKIEVAEGPGGALRLTLTTVVYACAFVCDSITCVCDLRIAFYESYFLLQFILFSNTSSCTRSRPQVIFWIRYTQHATL